MFRKAGLLKVLPFCVIWSFVFDVNTEKRTNLGELWLNNLIAFFFLLPLTSVRKPRNKNNMKLT